MKNPFHAIGVDLGGTKIAAGLVSFPEGKLIRRFEIKTRADRSGEEVFQDVESMVRELCADAVIGAIGLGICELVDRARNIVSANCLDWMDLPVRERLSRLAPTIIEADVRAAAFAEAQFGAGKNARVFLYVTIGTGISSCLVLDGEPFPGARGASGTMASGPLPQFDGCSEMCLEQFSSGPALVARYQAVGGVAGSGQEVLAAAQFDPRALAVARSAGGLTGAAIGSLVNVLDPELVILGGGLGLAPGVYRDALVDSLRRHIWWPGHRDLPVLSAQTGAHAGVIGAAAAAWRALGPI